MLTASTPQIILDYASDDGRRVISLWRSLIYVRRATQSIDPELRRWQNIPENTSDVLPTIRRMRANGDVDSLESAPGCYVATAPYARNLPIRERELLFELNPYVTLSHYSALEYHGLTLNRPNLITVSAGEVSASRILGTSSDEWEELALPVAYRPSRVLAQRVRWFGRQTDQSFGIDMEYESTIPIRVSDLERSLIESLQWPGYAGGMNHVLNAWRMGSMFFDPDIIVEYTERFGINLLRQRVGFILEELGISHPRLEQWASQAARGGSSRLVTSQPYNSNYSERWNLSLNASIGYLHEE